MGIQVLMLTVVAVFVLQRAPDKRAPAVVSLGFTALAAAPLLLLLGYLTSLGVNFKVGGIAHLAAAQQHTGRSLTYPVQVQRVKSVVLLTPVVRMHCIKLA